METLLAIITIIQRAGGKRLLLRLFSRLMVVLALVFTTSIMASAILIGGLINAHIALLDGGMSSPLALLIVACSGVLMIVALIAVTAWHLKGLQRLPRQSTLVDALDAFTAGLMER